MFRCSLFLQHSVVQSEPSARLSDTSSHSSHHDLTSRAAGTGNAGPSRRAFPERGARTHRDSTNTRLPAARANKPGVKLDVIAGKPLFQRVQQSRLSKSLDNIHTTEGTDPSVAQQPSALKLPYLTSPSVPQLQLDTELSYSAVNDVIQSQRSRLKELQSTPLNKPCIPMPVRKTGVLSNGFYRGQTQDVITKQVGSDTFKKRKFCYGIFLKRSTIVFEDYLDIPGTPVDL